MRIVIRTPNWLGDLMLSLPGIAAGGETDRAAGCAIESRLASARPAAGKVINFIGQTDLSSAQPGRVATISRCHDLSR